MLQTAKVDRAHIATCGSRWCSNRRKMMLPIEKTSPASRMSRSPTWGMASPSLNPRSAMVAMQIANEPSMTLDERELQQLLIRIGRHVAHDDRNLQQARALRRAPAALAGDDAVQIADALHENRLNDAVFLDGSRQLVELRLVPVHARLLLVRRDEIDVDLDRALPRRLGHVGNQRAQSLAERRSSFEHLVPPEIQAA